MRGYFPLFLAVGFGIVNGYYIFKPMVIEARLKRLQEQGIDVGAVGAELRRAQEIAEANAREKSLSK